MNDLPLLELYTRLRGAGLLLGIDEYILFLRALQAGLGISDRQALARLCRTLWTKSVEEMEVFDYYFEQEIDQHTAAEDTLQSPEPLLQRFETPPASSQLTQTPDLTTLSFDRITLPDSMSPVEFITKKEDEVEVAQALLQMTSERNDVTAGYFIQTDEYFPVTRRQMKQSWRYLRRPVRKGPSVDLDLEATVNTFARQGVLFEPVLVPRRTNQAELLLLIDQDGSMAPFHALSRRLADSALRGGRLRKADIYYFHNCPFDYFYRDTAYQEAEAIEDVLHRPHHKLTGLLVFSDAGAARGGISPERIDLTKSFLDRFKRQFRYMAWINPMPYSRWLGTTAEEIMHLIPMFDLSRRGLDNAIRVLLGRTSHFVSTVGYKRNE